MSNIFKQFILARPVKTPLDFGHNDNVYIETIDFEVREKKGIKIKANTFIRLTKIEPDTKKALASTEINFWNLDPSKDFVYDNFISQFSILSGIIDAVDGDVEKYEDYVLEVVEGEDDSATLTLLKKPENSKIAQKALVQGFKDQMISKIGDTNLLLKCKMISNKKGYLLPAADIMWMLPMKSTEKLPQMTSREKSVYKNSMTAETTAKPDTTGAAPSGEKKINATGLDGI